MTTAVNETSAASVVARLTEAEQHNNGILLGPEEITSLLDLVRTERTRAITDQAAAMLSATALPPGAIVLQPDPFDKRIEQIRALLDAAMPSTSLANVRYLMGAHDDLMLQNRLLLMIVHTLHESHENAVREIPPSGQPGSEECLQSTAPAFMGDGRALPYRESAAAPSPTLSNESTNEGQTADIADPVGCPAPLSTLGIAVETHVAGGSPEPEEGTDSDRGEAAEEREEGVDPSGAPLPPASSSAHQ